MYRHVLMVRPAIVVLYYITPPIRVGSTPTIVKAPTCGHTFPGVLWYITSPVQNQT